MRAGKATLFAVFLALTGCNSGFTDSDIEQVKSSIRAELEKQPGITVIDVTMMKESGSPNKLTGFAKVKVPLFGEMMKSCSATMGEKHEFIWQCK